MAAPLLRKRGVGAQVLGQIVAHGEALAAVRTRIPQHVAMRHQVAHQFAAHPEAFAAVVTRTEVDVGAVFEGCRGQRRRRMQSPVILKKLWPVI